MLFITLMTKCLIQWKRSTKYVKSSPKLSRAPQGRRLGDERLEVLVLVLNKYNTNYEAIKLADSTALAFKSWQNFIKVIYYKLMNYHKPSYIVINQN